MISKSVNLVLEKVNSNDMLEQEIMGAPDFFFDKIDVCDLLELSDNDQLFVQLCDKLVNNGTIILRGMDAMSLTSKVSTGEIPLDTFNQILKSVRRLNSLVMFKKFFIEHKWNIKFTGYDEGSRYIIEATKP